MNILSYKGYHGKFAYAPEEDIFHGEILHLADVITFQGRSIDELKQALADSIGDYLEFCTLSGKTPQKPYSGKFNVRIPPELHQRVVTQAIHDGKSLNMWVAETLDRATSTHGSHS